MSLDVLGIRSFSAAFKLFFRPANRATVDVVFGITVTATSLLLGEVGLVSGLVDLRDPTPGSGASQPVMPRLARLTSKMAGNLPSCTRSVLFFWWRYVALALFVIQRAKQRKRQVSQPWAQRNMCAFMGRGHNCFRSSQSFEKSEWLKYVETLPEIDCR
jgi:hypothetical protein